MTCVTLSTDPRKVMGQEGNIIINCRKSIDNCNYFVKITDNSAKFINTV